MFDSQDAGLFNSKDSDIQSWKLKLDTKNWKIEQISRTDDSDLRVSLEKFRVIEVNSAASEAQYAKRFPWLLMSEQGFSIDINRSNRDTEVYKNIDMTVKFTCSGAMKANW